MEKILLNTMFFTSIITFISLIAINIFIILNRYFLNTSFSGGQELSLLLITWSIFLGFSKVVSEKEDISVTFFIDKLPDTVYRYVQLLLVLLFILTSGWILLRSYSLMISQGGMTTEILSIPSSLFTLPVLILMIYMIFHFLIKLFEFFIKDNDKERGEQNWQ